MTLAQFQEVIRDIYSAKDQRRGVEGTFMWFMEEVGELATALRDGTAEERSQEFADVLAWLVTLANVVNVNLEAAVQAKSGGGGASQIWRRVPGMWKDALQLRSRGKTVKERNWPRVRNVTT